MVLAFLTTNISSKVSLPIDESLRFYEKFLSKFREELTCSKHFR